MIFFMRDVIDNRVVGHVVCPGVENGANPHEVRREPDCHARETTGDDLGEDLWISILSSMLLPCTAPNTCPQLSNLDTEV